MQVGFLLFVFALNPKPSTFAKPTGFACRIVDAEAALMGDPGRVLLGGASQGCCAAFDAFARHPTRIGGLSGCTAASILPRRRIEHARKF